MKLYSPQRTDQNKQTIHEEMWNVNVKCKDLSSEMNKVNSCPSTVHTVMILHKMLNVYVDKYGQS